MHGMTIKTCQKWYCTEGLTMSPTRCLNYRLCSKVQKKNRDSHHPFEMQFQWLVRIEFDQETLPQSIKPTHKHTQTHIERVFCLNFIFFPRTIKESTVCVWRQRWTFRTNHFHSKSYNDMIHIITDVYLGIYFQIKYFWKNKWELDREKGSEWRVKVRWKIKPQLNQTN